MTPQEHALIDELDEQRERHRLNAKRIKRLEERAEQRRMVAIRDEQKRLRSEFYARRDAA
jgi:hypothetical protein